MDYQPPHGGVHIGGAVSESSQGTYITVLGTRYSVVSDRDDEYVSSLAVFLNDQLERFGASRGASLMQRVILTALNIADELFTERARRRDASKEIERRAEELIAMLDVLDAASGSSGTAMTAG